MFSVYHRRESEKEGGGWSEGRVDHKGHNISLKIVCVRKVTSQ